MKQTTTRRTERQAAAFSELARRLSAVSTAKDAARVVMGTADVLFGWDACIFELCSEEKVELSTVLAFDRIDGHRTDVTMQAMNTPSGAHTLQTLKEGARLVLRPEPAGFAVDTVPFGDRQRPSASLMFAPVRVENEAIAVLSVQSYQHQAYSESDLRLFQAMADHCGSALKRVRAEAALRESTERLRQALIAGQMGTWNAELKGGRRVQISPELEMIFGLKPYQFAGSPRAILELVHPEDRTLVRKAIGRALRAQGDYELEFRFLPHDRPPGWLFARGRAYGDSSGRPTKIAGVAMDITRRKIAEQEILRLNTELERRVGERTAQLEATNRELEAFSYSVSHDLKAPLRSIRGFSEALLEHHAAQLDRQGREFLRRVCESSQHMDKLIEDLLELSRLSRSELQRRQVNLSELAKSISQEIQQAEANRAVAIAITPGLIARGDERLLRVVLENLLRNAWKFSSKKSHPRIEFGFLPSGVRAFYVRDNGAGFDMAFANRLFGVFQRLHSASEFPGTGIGLATVKRVISRHGGHVWADATPDKGATFYFTLPEIEHG